MNELISGMMLVMSERDLKMAARFTGFSSEDDTTSAIGVEAVGGTDSLGTLSLGNACGGNGPGLLAGTVGAVAGDDGAGVVETGDGAEDPRIRFRILWKTLDRRMLITGHHRNWLDRSLR
jgi:hypothetical protein